MSATVMRSESGSPRDSLEVASSSDRSIRHNVSMRVDESLVAGAMLARLHSFDIDDAPIVSDLPDRPGELVRAVSIVQLASAHIGQEILVLRAVADGQKERVVVVGRLAQTSGAAPDTQPVQSDLQADEDR